MNSKAKIKLLHITSSLKIGGAERVLCDLIQYLDSNIFEHHVIYFHAGPHVQTLHELGVPTYHIRGAISLYDPIFFARLYRTIKKINPDTMHTLLWAANVSGRIVGKLLKIPVMSAYHNNVDQDGALRAWFDRATLKWAHQLVAVSDGVAQSLQLRDPWLQAPRLVVIPNGIDTSVLHANNQREAVSRAPLGLAEHDFVVGSVGRFVPVKRYDLLIDAFALAHQHNNALKLLLVGVGPLEQELRAHARKHGLEAVVTFVIGQPAYRYYRIFDCFAQTSDKEGISIALLEAMSFGVPCVVTTMEKGHAVIEHLQTGVLVAAGDAHAIAHNFLMMAQNHAVRRSISHSASQLINHKFRLDRMIERYTAVFLASVV